jgi:membrane-associated phospholipid phosphatase
MVVAAAPGASTDEPTADRRLAVRLLLSSVLAIAGAILCYYLLLRTSLGQRFDYSAHIGSYPVNPNVLAGKAMRSVTGYLVAVVIVVLVVIGFVRRRPLLGVAGAVAVGVAVVAADVLKDDVLTRPFLTREVPRAANSFPSGHAAATMVCAIALVLVVPARWRSLVAIFAGAYGCLSGVQQQTTSSHYPSDVIGATLLAFGAVAGVAGILAWFRPVEWGRNRYNGMTQAGLGVAAAVAGALSVWGVAKVLSWLGSHPVAAPAAAISYAAFLTGIALSVAVGIAVVIWFLALLGGAELS